MAIRRHDEERLVIWPETTLGTRPVTPVGYIMPYFDADLGATEPVVENTVKRWDMNSSQPGRGKWSLEGRKVNVPIERSAIGIWLKAYFGAPATTGAADPYTHTFKRSLTNGPSFGAEVWNDAADKGDSYDGLVVYGLEFTVDPEDGMVKVGVMIAGLGKNTLANGTEVDAMPVATFTDDEFVKLGSSVKVDGAVSDYVVSATLRLERGISIRAIPDGNSYRKHIILGREKVSWNVTALFDDAGATRALATGRAEHTAEMIFAHPSNANHQLSLLSQEVQLYLTNAPAVSEGNEREITLDGVAYLKNGAASSQIVAALKNPDATVTF